MPDWRAMVRARLSGSGLRPTAELDVVEEVAQHVEDRYRQLCAEGLDPEDARARSLSEIDGEDFVADLRDVLPWDDA